MVVWKCAADLRARVCVCVSDTISVWVCVSVVCVLRVCCEFHVCVCACVCVCDSPKGTGVLRTVMCGCTSHLGCRTVLPSHQRCSGKDPTMQMRDTSAPSGASTAREQCEPVAV